MVVQHMVVKTPNFTNFNKNHFSPKYKNAYFYMSFLVREIEKSRVFFCHPALYQSTLPRYALCQCTLSRHFAKAAFCKGMHFVKALCQNTLPGQHFATAGMQTLCQRQACTHFDNCRHVVKHFVKACRQAFCQDVLMTL